MSSTSKFDKFSDSIESVSADSSQHEATTTSEMDENEETDISSSAVKSTRKTLLDGIRARGRGRIRFRGRKIALSSIVQPPMGSNTGISDTYNIDKDTDTFTSDTDNNSKDLNDNETRRQN